MRFDFFGFQVDSTTPLVRVLIAAFVVGFILLFLVTSNRREAKLQQRIAQIAGTDLLMGIRPEWKRRPQDRDLFPGNLWAQGYRLSDSMARELMDSCEARGGQRMAPDEIAMRYPDLEKRILVDSPSCVHSQESPKRAVSMLNDTRLTVHLYGL